jgi:hypothetical protein
MTEKTTYRCAVYTRKSTEEGLDQAFNSLDAQREACEAYIAPQAGLGWKLIRTRYDDGGVSGAPWTALPRSNCSVTSSRPGSTLLSSTRSTA